MTANVRREHTCTASTAEAEILSDFSVKNPKSCSWLMLVISEFSLPLPQ